MKFFSDGDSTSGSLFLILSPRERQVLALVSSGCSNKQIAYRLSIALSTVKGYIAALAEGLGTANRVELCLWAIAHPAATEGRAVKTNSHGWKLPGDFNFGPRSPEMTMADPRVRAGEGRSRELGIP